MKIRISSISVLALPLLATCLLAQVPVMRDGRPALRFSTSRGDSFVEQANGSEPALRFSLFLYRSLTCTAGWLRVSATKMAWEPTCGNPGFEFPLASLTTIGPGGQFVHIEIAGQVPPVSRVGGVATGRGLDFGSGVPGGAKTGSVEMGVFLARSLQDFPAAYADFKRLTASLQPGSQREAAPERAPQQLSKLEITTTPPSAQVYLDNEFKGTSDEDGKLMISDIPPGAHTVRLTALGYREVKQTITVATGENPLTISAERAGPKPLTFEDVRDALQNGLSKKRVVELVKEYGVDFSITPEREASLHTAGADDSVLYAISQHKR